MKIVTFIILQEKKTDLLSFALSASGISDEIEDLFDDSINLPTTNEQSSFTKICELGTSAPLNFVQSNTLSTSASKQQNFISTIVSKPQNVLSGAALLAQNSRIRGATTVGYVLRPANNVILSNVQTTFRPQSTTSHLSGVPNVIRPQLLVTTNANQGSATGVVRPATIVLQTVGASGNAQLTKKVMVAPASITTSSGNQIVSVGGQTVRIVRMSAPQLGKVPISSNAVMRPVLTSGTKTVLVTKTTLPSVTRTNLVSTPAVSVPKTCVPIHRPAITEPLMARFDDTQCGANVSVSSSNQKPISNLARTKTQDKLVISSSNSGIECATVAMTITVNTSSSNLITASTGTPTALSIKPVSPLSELSTGHQITSSASVVLPEILLNMPLTSDNTFSGSQLSPCDLLQTVSQSSVNTSTMMAKTITFDSLVPDFISTATSLQENKDSISASDSATFDFMPIIEDIPSFDTCLDILPISGVIPFSDISKNEISDVTETSLLSLNSNVINVAAINNVEKPVSVEPPKNFIPVSSEKDSVPTDNPISDETMDILDFGVLCNSTLSDSEFVLGKTQDSGEMTVSSSDSIPVLLPADSLNLATQPSDSQLPVKEEHKQLTEAVVNNSFDHNAFSVDNFLLGDNLNDVKPKLQEVKFTLWEDDEEELLDTKNVKIEAVTGCDVKQHENVFVESECELKKDSEEFKELTLKLETSDVDLPSADTLFRNMSESSQSFDEKVASFAIKEDEMQV